MSDEQIVEAKNLFITAHLNKIRESDAILIANYSKEGISGYIGSSSILEAAFSKRIYVLKEIGDQSCRPEMPGLKPIIIRGDLKGIFTR